MLKNYFNSLFMSKMAKWSMCLCAEGTPFIGRFVWQPSYGFAPVISTFMNKPIYILSRNSEYSMSKLVFDWKIKSNGFLRWISSRDRKSVVSAKKWEKRLHNGLLRAKLLSPNPKSDDTSIYCRGSDRKPTKRSNRFRRAEPEHWNLL